MRTSHGATARLASQASRQSLCEQLCSMLHSATFRMTLSFLVLPTALHQVAVTLMYQALLEDVPSCCNSLYLSFRCDQCADTASRLASSPWSQAVFAGGRLSKKSLLKGPKLTLCMPLLMRRPLMPARSVPLTASTNARCLQAASLRGWRWAPSSILATTGSCVS